MFSLLIKYSFIYEFLAIIALFNLELEQLVWRAKRQDLYALARGFH